MREGNNFTRVEAALRVFAYQIVGEGAVRDSV
jgi:hypothetical protein